VEKNSGLNYVQAIGFLSIAERPGLVHIPCSRGFMSRQQSTQVLPNLKINLPLTEDEILNCIDLCAIAKEALELFEPKDSALQMETLMKLRSRFYEAHEHIWESKEIKTRKNSLLNNTESPSIKNNPRLMEEFYG